MGEFARTRAKSNTAKLIQLLRATKSEEYFLGCNRFQKR